MSDPKDQHGTGDGEPVARPGVSRRALLGGGIAAGLGVVAGAGGALVVPKLLPGTDDSELIDLSQSHPFYATAAGASQPGIRTAPQRYCVFMTFDLSSPTARDLQVLLARWSAAIAQLQKGQTVGAVTPANGVGPGRDTGEALDLGPASLTVTVGLGPGVFDDRFGLAGRRPRLLSPLPALPSDRLDPALTGGDLSLQACADDPQVAYHAIRDLARIARGTATVRWTVLGFGRASAGPAQHTPRNLLGFKDGTRNISSDADYRSFVWTKDDQRWMSGGTYQVVRKIQMNIEIWDADNIADQQDIFGRTKVEGAPLSGRNRAHGARTSPLRTQTAARRSRFARTSPSPRTRTTTGSRSCGGRTTTPTGSTSTASSTPGCCSSAIRTTRTTSCGCSAASARPTG